MEDVSLHAGIHHPAARSLKYGFLTSSIFVKWFWTIMVILVKTGQTGDEPENSRAHTHTHTRITGNVLAALTWTWRSRRVRLHHPAWSRRSLRTGTGVRHKQTLNAEYENTHLKSPTHSFSRCPSFPAAPAGVLLSCLTSSVDLDPWVKDSDSQRAGKLIDPILQPKRKQHKTRQVLVSAQCDNLTHVNAF